DLYSNADASFRDLNFNGKNATVGDTSQLYRGTKNSALIRYFVSGGDSLQVNFSAENEVPISFKVMEYSFDLMSNPLFTIPNRPDFMMPKPFVITDAIAVKRTFFVDSLRLQVIEADNLELTESINP